MRRVYRPPPPPRRTLNDWSRGKQLENIEIWGKQNLLNGPVFKQFVIWLEILKLEIH